MTLSQHDPDRLPQSPRTERDWAARARARARFLAAMDALPHDAAEQDRLRRLAPPPVADLSPRRSADLVVRQGNRDADAC
jgi:hypothetical protein